MTEPELKPCPFCGSEASLEKGPSAYSIECAKGSSCIGSGLLIGFMHNALDRAVNQWNTRTDLSQAAIAAAMMDDRKADWQSEAMHQNRLLHDALTRAQTAEAKLAKALSVLRLFKYFDDMPLSAKRPDVFERKVRHPVLAALAEIEEETK